MRTFLELPVSLYRKFESPKAANNVHMKTSRPAATTCGMAAIKPEIFPAGQCQQNSIKCLEKKYTNIKPMIHSWETTLMDIKDRDDINVCQPKYFQCSKWE